LEKKVQKEWAQRRIGSHTSWRSVSFTIRNKCPWNWFRSWLEWISTGKQYSK
jgi:hypothetical protein